MSLGTALVTIVAILAFAALRIVKLQSGAVNRRSGADQQPPPPAPDAAMTREIAELRSRIAVLERIVTDDRHGKAIADEIENLRGN